MAQAIVSVLQDSHIRDTLIEQGRRRARQFSPRAVAEVYRDLAQDCMDRRRATRGLRRGNGV
jgi:hypothetical protein